MMNGEPGDSSTPVRRSSRARKPNSRFADDELDGCFKKIVSGLTSPENPTPSPLASPTGRFRKTWKKKDNQSEEGGEIKINELDIHEKTEKNKYDVAIDQSQVHEKDIVRDYEPSVNERELSEKCEATVDSVIYIIESENLVNGLESGSENVKVANSSKSQSECEKSEIGRRTRSSAKKDDVESFSKDAKKCGARKRGKVKKTEEEGEMVESEIVSEDGNSILLTGSDFSLNTQKVISVVITETDEVKHDLVQSSNRDVILKDNLIEQTEKQTQSNVVSCKSDEYSTELSYEDEESIDTDIKDKNSSENNIVDKVSCDTAVFERKNSGSFINDKSLVGSEIVKKNIKENVTCSKENEQKNNKKNEHLDSKAIFENTEISDTLEEDSVHKEKCIKSHLNDDEVEEESKCMSVIEVSERLKVTGSLTEEEYSKSPMRENKSEEKELYVDSTTDVSHDVLKVETSVDENCVDSLLKSKEVHREIKCESGTDLSMSVEGRQTEGLTNGDICYENNLHISPRTSSSTDSLSEGYRRSRAPDQESEVFRCHKKEMGLEEKNLSHPNESSVDSVDAENYSTREEENYSVKIKNNSKSPKGKQKLMKEDSAGSVDSNCPTPSRHLQCGSLQMLNKIMGEDTKNTVEVFSETGTSELVTAGENVISAREELEGLSDFDKQFSEVNLMSSEESQNLSGDRIEHFGEAEAGKRRKGKRDRGTEDDHDFDDKNNVQRLLRECVRSPEMKKKRESDSKDESDIVASDYDNQKRKRSKEPDEEDQRKRRKMDKEREKEPEVHVPMVEGKNVTSVSLYSQSANIDSYSEGNIEHPTSSTYESNPRKSEENILVLKSPEDCMKPVLNVHEDNKESEVFKDDVQLPHQDNIASDQTSLKKNGRGLQGVKEFGVIPDDCNSKYSSTLDDSSIPAIGEQMEIISPLSDVLALSVSRSANVSPRTSAVAGKPEEPIANAPANVNTKHGENSLKEEHTKSSLDSIEENLQSFELELSSQHSFREMSHIDKAVKILDTDDAKKEQHQEKKIFLSENLVSEVSDDKENLKPKLELKSIEEKEVLSTGDEPKLEEIIRNRVEDVHFDDGDVDNDEVDTHSVESICDDFSVTSEETVVLRRKLQHESEENEQKNKIIVEGRMQNFVHITENLYIGERKKSKRSKEVRRMVCDCSLTKEEIARGEVGCGEDCLNRLLMIECGSRCPLKERCTNKRFQNFEYADVEVFNADEKGCGVRALSPLAPGTFIMEYVGEVFDTREFKKRKKEYAREQSSHFYFMALKSDQLIDATRKGNISRFINHSCDPNTETQKWTVNGELRIGFFTKKYVEAGEEISFDYRLERYGREPQRCYCGTQVCRGWLGESPEEKTKEEKDEERRKEERDKRRREERRAFFEDIDLEDEIEKLNSHKLRNRQDTLNLSRLMVRAEDFNSRILLLELVQTGEPACRRLFLDYHGLKVLWSWMAALGFSLQHTALKIEILKTLECLPITNKTQLTDSRILALVERWSTQSSDVLSTHSPPPPPPPKPDHLGTSVSSDSDSNKKTSDTSEESDTEIDTKAVLNSIEGSSADDSSLDSEVEQPSLSTKKMVEGTMAEEDSSDSNQSDGKEIPTTCIKEEDETVVDQKSSDKEAQEILELHRSMVALALKLLDTWKNLKEFFRIPKKERIELMKEHEREVDRGYKEYLDREQDDDRDRRDKDRDRYNRRDSYHDRRRRSPDRDRDRYRRIGRSERDAREDRASDSPKMSKEQRRQLFEMKVQQEEEEAKQRKMQEEMWAMHVDRCRLLGQDPYLTPIFDPTYQYYWDPVAANWQPYNGSDPNIPVPATYGQHKSDADGGSPLAVLVSGQSQPSQPLPGYLASDSDSAAPGLCGLEDPLNPANIPLPGEISILPQASPSQPLPGQAVPCEGTPPQGAKVLSIPLPGETTSVIPTVLDPNSTPSQVVENEEGPPPPPPPGPITIQLPPRWKIARNSEGHVYFYHVKTRTSQWEPPTLEQHQQLEAELGSDSDSDSSSSDDSDSTSTSDSEDFSSDEEEEEVVFTIERSDLTDETMIKRTRSKKHRSEALVQERVISPIMEIDREAARRERREAKERAKEEARFERQEERQTRIQKERPDPIESLERPVMTELQERIEHSERSEWQERNETSERVERNERSDRSERYERQERSERNDRYESRAKREKVKSKERAATAIADNSDTARRIKDNFRSKMATFIVSVLNPYRRGDCKEGRITCTEDFKYLARKLTHFVMVKELKQLHSIEALECSDSVKHKTRDFVRKYMAKYGPVFKRDPNDTKEY